MRFVDPSQDHWHALPAEGEAGAGTPRADSLLTPEQWLVQRVDWPADLPVGLLITNTLDVDTIGAELCAAASRIVLLVLHVPKWTDGRAYSQARLLRVRHAFDGEIRATGDVVVDMLPLLQRTGFDAVQLRADQDIEVARRALGFFARHYQGDVLQPQPLFTRLAA
jgi:uncharacterized protein (DUF934 family)